MSIKIIDFEANKKKNGSVQKRILQHENQAQKHFVFQKPKTPLLSDISEFPSLSESLGASSNYLPSTSNYLLSGGSLKYSDKLKSSSCVSANFHFNCNAAITDAHHYDSKIARSKFQNADNKNKTSDNAKQIVRKQVSNQSQVYEGKKELAKPKPVFKPKLKVQSLGIKPPTTSFDDANVLTKSSIQSNKSVNVEKSELKGENSAIQDSSATKKKKLRKSKIKRQVAQQCGKITFLTPEIHSKILNQAINLSAHSSVGNSALGNIDDDDEYPELGKAVLPISQKENFLKKNILTECQEEDDEKPISLSTKKYVVSENITKDIPLMSEVKDTAVEKKEKLDKVHSHNPITISFYDMLIEKNAKKKEIEELQIESLTVVEMPKLKNKKNLSHPHNALDASSPAVKRGKERENPKPKRPSKIKKIILLDRKTRREHLLQMKNSFINDVTNDGLMLKSREDENDQVAEKDFENDFEFDLSMFWNENEDDVDAILQLGESVPDELIPEMVHLNITEEIDSYDIVNDQSSNFKEVKEKEDFEEKTTSILPLNDMSRPEKDDSVSSQVNSDLDVDRKKHLGVPQSPETLLNSLIESLKPVISEDREKAVKILLHTRHFRQYCNHLISKDIDEVTHALLDDLARFQDRLHQKDPVKARMKKRMIYGVREVKKYIKLRKVKCIIIAADIENVETQGGLNDVVNEIKMSAVDHHIPYVFALSRKLLGKVCRKPVPVSCIGIFNYEGSEANFKKMVELQSQSKDDYAELFSKLILKITDEEIAALIKAKKEAPETLHDVRTNILSNIFVPSDLIKSEEESIASKSDEEMLSSIDWNLIDWIPLDFE